MRVIVEAFGRAFAWELSFAQVRVANAVEVHETAEEFEEAPPVDPHGTLAAQVERRSDLEDMAMGKQPEGMILGFGFNGSQG